MFALTIAEGVATLTLSRAPVNAISEEWMRRFDGELDALAARDDWKVLHLRSDQKVFCAGADLREVQAFMQMADGPDRMYAFVANIQRLYARIERIDRVTLAEIGGAAMGGGLELALSCDLRVAAAEAKIALPEARLGLIPAAGGTQRLTRLCGPSAAARLILGAEVLDGMAAREFGVVQWAYPRAELAERTREIARRVAELPVAALVGCKACMATAREPGRGGFSDELEVTRRLLTNKETQQRVTAFLAGQAGDARVKKGAN
jgi:enoyl-CoA hydratase/carnithine racemase